jgi:hypothetical protein
MHANFRLLIFEVKNDVPPGQAADTEVGGTGRAGRMRPWVRLAPSLRLQSKLIIKLTAHLSDDRIADRRAKASSRQHRDEPAGFGRLINIRHRPQFAGNKSRGHGALRASVDVAGGI